MFEVKVKVKKTYIPKEELKKYKDIRKSNREYFGIVLPWTEIAMLFYYLFVAYEKQSLNSN